MFVLSLSRSLARSFSLSLARSLSLFRRQLACVYNFLSLLKQNKKGRIFSSPLGAPPRLIFLLLKSRHLRSRVKMDIAISTLIREFRESRNGYVHFTLDLEKRKRKKERRRKRERRRERRTARAHATERERRTARAHATERERRTAARKKEKYWQGTFFVSRRRIFDGTYQNLREKRRHACCFFHCVFFLLTPSLVLCPLSDVLQTSPNVSKRLELTVFLLSAS